ncbi:MAG: motility protein A [Lachnospiraceae bacterium]|nr:motility protein A [Lachnospiraceae bacterium]
MDFATIIGLVVGLIALYVGIVGSSGTIAPFFNIPSVFVVFVGALSSMATTNTIPDLIAGLKSFTLILKVPVHDIKSMITKIIELSNIARKEGLLSLEEAASDLNDPFLKKGILLIVDGTDPDLVRGIMETELVSIEARHKKKINFWEALGAYGPSWGMKGTLLGLIIALGNLSDVESLGPTMAMTFITTLYGSLLANMLCGPVAGKLKIQNDNEMMIKEIMIEGLLSIQAGENPRVIEEKLKSFLAPSDRVADTSGSEGGGGEDG